MLDEEAIFNAALDRADGDARTSYLDEVCSHDPALRRRIELLLSAFGEGECLQAPAGLAATVLLPPVGEKPGTVIGPYKLLEQIGEGGMGLVFMAEQSQPLRRRVALKIIKPGLDTKAVIARFEAERQALALMNHPHIARVYDAGAAESGRPYFVMELVRGVPITEYCNRHELDLRDRLELVIQVCQAVQHAHQKGIIHRDLKPTNILVAHDDTTPVPKIIDFGVAKATNQQLTERTLFTHFAQVIGTPLYMSPEQAELNYQDIDTRSDVYSLGVVLYELLTGTTPFDAERLRSIGPDEMRRIIREEEPPKPSTRATTVAAATTIAASQKHGSARLGAHALKGDLDWIVMKALEKDRRRRYESPGALAADIRRYLDDEPVEACPPSRKYRVVKFVRRNRIALTTAALLVVTILGGAAVSVWQAVRATNAERRATSALSTAEARLKIARQAVDEMYGQVAEKWLSQHGELAPVQREFLDKALALYEALASERGEDPQSKFDVAQARYRVATIQKALGNSADAQASYESAIKEFEEVPAVFAEGAGRRELGRTLIGLGNVHRDANRHKTAEALLKRGVAILDEHVAGHPEDRKARDLHGRTLLSLGNAYMDIGRKQDAERVFRRGQEIFTKLMEEEPKSAEYINNTAHAAAALGKFSDREKAFARAFELREKAIALEPNNPDYRFDSARDITNSLPGLNTEKPEKAFEADCRVVKISQELVDEFPDRPAYLEMLVNGQTNLGMDLRAMGRWAESEEVLRRAVTSSEKLATIPGNPDYQANFACALIQLSRVLIENQREQEAANCASRGIGIVRELVARYPDRESYKDFGGNWLKQLVLDACHKRNWRVAIDAAEGCIAVHGKGGWSLYWLILAVSHAKLGDMDKARSWYAKAEPKIVNGPEGDTPQWLVDEARKVFAAAKPESALDPSANLKAQP